MEIKRNHPKNQFNRKIGSIGSIEKSKNRINRKIEPMLTHLVDLHNRRIYPAEITLENGRIARIRELAQVPAGAGYLMPGFIDAHVHIESSMLPPSEFARMAVVHGTVATVSDPHEIANVLGSDGVAYMLEDAARVPLKVCFGAPSCVPATAFETAGAAMNADEVAALLQNPAIGYLSEMMNFPGVLHGDPEVMAKIAAAQQLGKPVDGHAPGSISPPVSAPITSVSATKKGAKKQYWALKSSYARAAQRGILKRFGRW